MKSILLNHIFSVLNQKSFPVIGDPKSSLIFALLFTAGILLVYLFIDHLPKPEKNKITAKKEIVYIKTLIALIVFAMISTAWDAWWHRAVGRDSFWILPHIGLYLFASSAMITGFYVWRHTRDVVWKHIFFLLLMIPTAAVFDNYFHTLWGVEDLSRPTSLAWGPGHIFLNLSVSATMVLLLKILLKDRKTSDFSFFGNLSFAAIFNLLLFIALPFYPTGPWGQVAGFAGAGIIVFLYIFIILSAEKVMQGRIDGTQTSIFSLIFILISYGKETASHIKIMPHDRAPIWLIVFTLVITGVLLDITKNRFPTWVRGLFGGIIFSGILFGFSTKFFAPQFQYGMTEIFTAITFSAIGGLVAGSIFGLFHLDDEKHIEKLLKKW
ncbi:MAG: hypothetical protein KW804_01280 [Candidatus Doudnabacteria bacterium]|nr:hypothetical protein [Candidatus Doudnabacteria bacterium]